MTFSAIEQAHMNRIDELAKTMPLIPAIDQANLEFYPKTFAPRPMMKGPRPKLEVRGEGEGRHPMMMSEIAAMWDGKMDEDEFVEKAMEVNEKYCSPPKPESKIRSQVQWIMRREPVKTGPAIVIGKPKLQGNPTIGSSFDFVLGPRVGEKHGIFALGSLHLVQGSSGNGKSNLMIQMLRAQHHGEPFFDRSGFQRRYLIVWQDRSRGELERQLDGMGMLDQPPPYVLAPEGSPAEVLRDLYEKETVKPQILFVEGLDMWAEDAKDMKHVSTLATAVRAVAEHYHVSIIATVGMPKMKPKERYAAPRDRAFGSSAWARKADTVVDVLVDEETELRHVQVLLRTGPPQRLTFAFENGLLVPREPAITVGPAGEAVPSIREIMRTHKCGPAKASEVREQMRSAYAVEVRTEVRTQPG